MRLSGETPTDESTGTPIALPILPNDLAGERSWHHTAHPHDHGLLQGIGGKAVRVARLQHVQGPGGTATLLNEANEIHENAGLHHRYHRLYEGPLLPETDAQRFGYCIMMLGGYIPGRGLDLSGKHPLERRIYRKELKRLRAGELRVGSYNLIQDFFAEHLLFSDENGHYDSRDLDDFLNTSKGAHRFQIGNRMIDTVVRENIQPWVRPYKDARRKGLLASSAQPSVLELVRSAFGRETTRQNFIEKMYQRIAAPALQTEVRVVQLAK